MFTMVIGLLQTKQQELIEQMQDPAKSATEKLALTFIYDDIKEAIRVLNREFFTIVPANTVRFEITADLEMTPKDFGAAVSFNSLPDIAESGGKVIQNALSTVASLDNIQIMARTQKKIIECKKKKGSKS